MVEQERPVGRSEREESPIGEKTSISDLHLLSRTQRQQLQQREQSDACIDSAERLQPRQGQQLQHMTAKMWQKFGYLKYYC